MGGKHKDGESPRARSGSKTPRVTKDESKSPRNRAKSNSPRPSAKKNRRPSNTVGRSVRRSRADGLPRHWTGDPTETSRRAVPDSIKEAVQAMLDGTWKNVKTRDRVKSDKRVCQFEVVQVLRNQNPDTWKYYQEKRNEIIREGSEKQFGSVNCKTTPYLSMFEEAGHTEPFHPGANEFLLFHGTNPSSADAICDNYFKLGKGSPKSLYGRGFYFAENSSKSDEYVREDNNYPGLFACLLCRVMCGRMKYDDAPRPDVDDLTWDVQDGHYHSVLGDREKARGTYREFIVYHSAQAYVEYIVIYRRKELSTTNLRTVHMLNVPAPPIRKSNMIRHSH